MSLIVLAAANNGFGNHIERLCASIATSQLQELNLAQNRIGTDGARYISGMLMGAYGAVPGIKKLSLAKNDIDYKGLDELC